MTYTKFGLNGTGSSYKGPIRVVRGRVKNLKDSSGSSPKTWCVLVTGKAAKLSMEKVVAVARSRWHIENTGFHQWTTRWRFAHVFAHNAHGILALYWLFFAAYNLLTLFLYRQLCSYGRDRGKDPTRTISRLVDEMLDDLARLQRSPWDTSFRPSGDARTGPLGSSGPQNQPDLTIGGPFVLEPHCPKTFTMALVRS